MDMKNLLAITLVFILSLFVVEESKGEIPDVMLRCEVIWTEPIEDRYWNSIRFTVFYVINSLSNTANKYYSNHLEILGVW